MKKIIIPILLLNALVVSLSGYSQIKSLKGISVAPEKLNISFLKTTNLIFPFEVQHVDLGSADIIAQKAKGVENILEIKAAKIGFRETNLSVVTKDGRFYSYNVTYTDTPAVLTINYTGAPQNARAIFTNNKPSEEELRILSGQVLNKTSEDIGTSSNNSNVMLVLKGLYIYNNIFYCHFSVTNNSVIGFDTGDFRFTINDQKKLKRTAYQEVELFPVFVSDPITKVDPFSSKETVIAFEKFTIPNAKFLQATLTEKNGARDQKIKITNGDLNAAKPL